MSQPYSASAPSLWRSFLERVPAWISPNGVTVAGIALVPPLVWAMIERRYVACFLLGVVSAFSDVLDGALARHRGQTSALGKFIDPVRDKLTICATLWILRTSPHPQFGVPEMLSEVPAWSLLTMETVLVAIRLPNAWRAMLTWLAGTPDPSKGEGLAANDWGKLKTIIEYAGIGTVTIGLGLADAGAVDAGTLVYALGWASLWIAMAYAALSIAGHLHRKRS